MAISTDQPAALREHLAKMGWTFTCLIDPKAKVLRQYDLVHQMTEDQVVARPAEFLIDPTGTVRWVDLTEDYRVRTQPEEVLEIFDGMNRK